MPTSAWPRETIGSLFASGAITAHKDGNYGSLYPRVEEFGDVGVPFLTAKSLDSGRIDIDGAPRLADSRADSLPFGFVQPNDVLLSHNATIGRVAVVPDFKGRMLVGTSLTYFRLNITKLRPRYFAAFLAGSDFQNQLAAVMSHSTRNQVPITAQRSLSVVVPPLEVQDMVALTVGHLDDKIEQNRRTGRKLEALARAVFKAWFVDFEPVKAKAAGATAFPGMPAHTFATLPTRLVESELGPVPDGWESRSLYSAAKFINGAAFKSSHFCEPSLGLPVVKIAELKYGITEQTKFSNRTDLDSRYKIETGDMLYSWSGSPDTSLDTFIWTKGPGLLNQHIFRVVTESDAQKNFVYYLLKHLKQDLIEIARNKQTTGLGHVTVGDMQRLLLAWPSADVIKAFDQAIGLVFVLSFNGLMETEKLAALRDYLLPRLLSGRVRVGVATAILAGEAVA